MNKSLKFTIALIVESLANSKQVQVSLLISNIIDKPNHDNLDATRLIKTLPKTGESASTFGFPDRVLPFLQAKIRE
ncbi:hypothetical protein [Streptococcus ictaluri]|uniref:hypothetical protein n=1 Tax=Streptococcus ictaluri TaxID=380397 RepID=UPI0012DE1254|nr:hypothetical protein [Streptococcus ictaluri]